MFDSTSRPTQHTGYRVTEVIQALVHKGGQLARPAVKLLTQVVLESFPNAPNVNGIIDIVSHWTILHINIQNSHDPC